MKEIRRMVSPPTGFADRVMKRVQAYKHAQARRHALVAVGVLTIALVGLFALAGLQLAIQIGEFVSLPSAVVPLLIDVASFAERAFTLIDALWIGVTTIASSVNSILLIVYASTVVGLTVVWLRVAFGPFQYPLKLSRRIEQ